MQQLQIPTSNRASSISASTATNIRSIDLDLYAQYQPYFRTIQRRVEDRFKTTIATALPDKLRSDIKARYDSLENALLPITKIKDGRLKARAIVGSTLASWLNTNSNSDPGATINLIVDGLSDLPLWAIEQACSDLRQGKVAGCNPDFAPSAARMHRHAEDLMAVAREEYANLRMLLSAQVRDEGQIKRETLKTVSIGFDDLRAALKKDAERDQAAREAALQRLVKHDEKVIREAYAKDKAEPLMVAGMLVTPELVASNRRRADMLSHHKMQRDQEEAQRKELERNDDLDI